ncbi:hypothetical protein GOP47_0013313 [Adiantum capillus-veneris]|uniref:TLDc domain-containing protein n=2 Tax=Adiantum capillus-veneris TaxID=13818 RepID=A0A9D4ZEF1_ADICA|nr:hypothetical protein GOP47_0013313 [Adiantum capillus-veneris]
MGNKQGRSSSPEFLSACRRFSTSELQDLRALFVSLASQSRSDGEFISASVFQAHYGIHGSLGSRLFDLVSFSRKDQRVYYEDLVMSKAIYEKGSPDEVEKFTYQLVDLLGDGRVQRSEAEAVVLSTLETVLGPKDAIPGAGLPESSIQGFVDAAELSTDGNHEAYVSDLEFRKWCHLIPSLKKFLGGLLTSPSADVLGRQVPQLRCPENIPSFLKREFAWHISGILPQVETQEWSLLYHSSVHGLSFNTFLSRLTSVGGPSVLLIKDEDGNMFGGYASQSWERHHDFFGDLKCFLFSLQPRSAIYRATGANNNMLWCAVNYTSESIPNGIGFGGQKNHFGIFLPASLDRGHAFPSVTFGNPCLSNKSTFNIDIIECWGVVLDTEESTKASASGGTILERFKEDRNMLNMVGIASASNSVG